MVMRYIVCTWMLWGGLLTVSPSHAALIFCNKSKQPLESSVAYREGHDWVSEGWWQLPPAQCIRVVSGSLNQRYYYYYVRSLTEPQRYWRGRYRFCTALLPYRITGTLDCQQRGYQVQGFLALDVGYLPHFLLDFNE